MQSNKERAALVYLLIEKMCVLRNHCGDQMKKQQNKISSFLSITIRPNQQRDSLYPVNYEQKCMCLT